MKYRKLLEQYQKNLLDEKTRGQIEDEIEKHEAISEYLCSQEEEIPKLQELFEAEGLKQKKEEESFADLVNRSIRRAFLKMGTVVLAVVLAVVLLIQFVLPHVISGFYYDPGKETGGGNNQMSLDMAVYSELFLPGKRRVNVVSEAKGYGKYDVDITQNVSYTGVFTTVSGELTRNHLRLYNENLLKQPTGNCFAWNQVYGDLTKSLSDLEKVMNTDKESYLFCAAGSPEEARIFAGKLNEDAKYIGYVSLEKMKDYEDFVRWMDSLDFSVGELWCAVKTEPYGALEGSEQIFHAENIGFLYDVSQSSSFAWDEEKYPNLITWNVPLEERSEQAEAAVQEESERVSYEMPEDDSELQKTEAYMKTHFTSLLRYMADHDIFLNLMGWEGNGIATDADGKEKGSVLREAADYVEQNGLDIYGFAAVMDKKTVLALMDQPDVYVVYTEPLQ